MGIICRTFGHDWSYEVANSANGDGRVIRIRRCTRCGTVENRHRELFGDYVWKPARLVTK